MSYPTYTLDNLDKTAEKHTDVDILEVGTGRALFTEAGARLLGLYPREDRPNTLWVSEDLDSYLAQGNWMVGGERLWISPERHFYYENPRDFDGFHVPAAMDPGDYERIAHCTYENTCALVDLHNNIPYDNSIMLRAFTVASDPWKTGLPFMGVSVNDTIEIDAPDAHFAAWSLAQLYSCGRDNPGTALFPIGANGSPINYFDPVPAARLAVHTGYCRFLIDADEIYKIGIAPEHMLFENHCKAVYLSPYPDSIDWFCLVKRCDAMPKSQSDCVDAARSNPQGPMGAIQSYNNGPGFSDVYAPFGEIELQLVKATNEDGKSVSKAHHELLSYAGTRQDMLEVARLALGLKEIPQIY